MGREDWIELYAHEYCHYTQHKDDFMAQFNDDVVWEWLAGKDYTYEAVEASVRDSQALEADNERRTVELIKKYGLPIDVGAYRQKCNAYIMFYTVVLKTRLWPEGTNPTYTDPAIFRTFPSDRILEDHEFLECSDDFYDAIVERCAGGRKKPTLWQRLRRRLFPVYDPRV